MINKIYKLFPDIEEAINNGDISEKRVLELNVELSTECNWCPYENGHCTVCGALKQVVYEETIDWEEVYRDYSQYQEQEHIEYDEWANVINECQLHFYGICNGKETGKPCDEPSPYGCSYKK